MAVIGWKFTPVARALQEQIARQVRVCDRCEVTALGFEQIILPVRVDAREMRRIVDRLLEGRRVSLPIYPPTFDEALAQFAAEIGCTQRFVPDRHIYIFERAV
jgi:hypothetical protein